MPVILATVVTLVLGGASVAQAVTAPALDAHTDLEFSLDGSTWTDAPDLVLGSWGCDLPDIPAAAPAAGPTLVTGSGAIVDPCAMLPGEAIDRSYHVRNATYSGRTGRYEVGVGDFEVSDGAEFAVSSTINTTAGAADSGTVMLYGSDTGKDGSSPARGARVAALELAPGESARVVDEVSVPLDVPNSAQRQSVSPRIWVSFTEVAELDRDGDGLPDATEERLGTDPDDPLNRLPDATSGRDYGPDPFLPASPPGVVLGVDASTLPPGMRLEGGVLTGAPTRAGTYDIAFTVTMPGGATHTSVRRVVVHASGGGSSDLPDFVWPVIVGGVIGGVIGILGPGLASVAGSIGSQAASGSSSGSLPIASDPDRPRPGDPNDPSGPSGPNYPSGPNAPGGPNDPIDPASSPGTGDAESTTTGDDGTGRVPESTVTRREAAPSDEWVRANSEVRGSLATTGVDGAELLLWALTAAAAGATLILFARRRHRDHEADYDRARDGEA